jgi:hypothetical protein
VSPIPSAFIKASLLLAVCSAALRSQTAASSPTTVPDRIFRLAIDSSRTEVLAHAMFDSLGARLTGSPDLLRSQDWLVKTYKSWGIDARNEKYGTWQSWRRGYSHIDMISPRVRTLEGMMLAGSPGTGKKDLTATTVILPAFADSAAFVRWLPAAKGKFVLISGAQPTCRPRSDWEANATPESKAKMDSLRNAVRLAWTSRNTRGTGYNRMLGTGDLGLRLEQGGAAGVITSRSKDAWGTIEVFETYNTKAPAVTLSCEDYGLVYRLTDRGHPPTLRMNLDASSLGELPVFNTIATIRGSEKPDEYVMLSAHFDSWDGSSGATDNGTGTLAVMEAMRILRAVYPNPKRTIIAGHWTGEEQTEAGSVSFTEDHPEVLKGLQVLFNQDNGTGRITRIIGAGLPDASIHLTSWLQALPASLKNQVSYQGPGRPVSASSDDFNFACHGLPAFNLNALGWDYDDYTWHTNRDTYDKVVFDDLKSNAALMAILAYMASEDPGFVGRDRVELTSLPGRQGGTSGTTATGASTPIPWPACEKSERSTKPYLR